MTTSQYFDATQFISQESLPSVFANLHLNEQNSINSSFIHRFFRTQFITLLKNIKNGHITLNDSIGSTTFGDSNHELKCEITIYDLNSYTKIALGGSNGSAQAYIDGLWSSDDPTALIRIIIRNRDVLNAMESGLSSFAQTALKVWHSLNRNSKQGSKKNITAHYDLGNDFFKLFLDSRMMYSSALYQNGDDLESASKRKLERICNTLKLTPNDHVIEIGTGWGGFACFAAKTVGCKVTTVTISQEQHNEAISQVKQQGLETLVSVKLQDYRDIEGQYDKLVSIEMIEAVGHQYLDGYFDKIDSLLKENGTALVQAIVIDDTQYQRALKEVDYIKRYIFPGSFIPCYEIITKTADQNNLAVDEIFDMGLSYAQTLRDWRKLFYQNLDQIKAQGYDAQFLRMWEFYLCYCEGGFDEQAISVGQISFSKKTFNSKC